MLDINCYNKRDTLKKKERKEIGEQIDRLVKLFFCLKSIRSIKLDSLTNFCTFTPPPTRPKCHSDQKKISKKKIEFEKKTEI